MRSGSPRRRRSPASPKPSPRSSRCAAARAPRSARVLKARLGEIAAHAQRAENRARPARRGDPRAACRTGRDVVRAVGSLRSRPPAPGSDPDRDQGRRPRGARSSGGACCAGAQLIDRQAAPIGRRLDFLAQELNREANTLCAKANDVELTNIGWNSRPRWSSSASKSRTWNRA